MIQCIIYELKATMKGYLRKDKKKTKRRNVSAKLDEENSGSQAIQCRPRRNLVVTKKIQYELGKEKSRR